MMPNDENTRNDSSYMEGQTQLMSRPMMEFPDVILLDVVSHFHSCTSDEHRASSPQLQSFVPRIAIEPSHLHRLSFHLVSSGFVTLALLWFELVGT